MAANYSHHQCADRLCLVRCPSQATAENERHSHKGTSSRGTNSRRTLSHCFSSMTFTHLTQTLRNILRLQILKAHHDYRHELHHHWGWVLWLSQGVQGLHFVYQHSWALEVMKHLIASRTALVLTMVVEDRASPYLYTMCTMTPGHQFKNDPFVLAFKIHLLLVNPSLLWFSYVDH